MWRWLATWISPLSVNSFLKTEIQKKQLNSTEAVVQTPQTTKNVKYHTLPNSHKHYQCIYKHLCVCPVSPSKLQRRLKYQHKINKKNFFFCSLSSGATSSFFSIEVKQGSKGQADRLTVQNGELVYKKNKKPQTHPLASEQWLLTANRTASKKGKPHSPHTGKTHLWAY